MKYEFYGRVKKEVMVSKVNEELRDVKRHHLNYPYSEPSSTLMIKKLQVIKEMTNGERLIKIFDKDDEVRFVKSYDSIDRDAIEKSEKIIINDLECRITNSFYDIDNGVIKFHLDKVFYHEKLDETIKKERMDKAKKYFDKEIDKLIKIFEDRKKQEEDYMKREPKGKLFKSIFK